MALKKRGAPTKIEVVTVKDLEQFKNLLNEILSNPEVTITLELGKVNKNKNNKS